ncbi:Alcohol dehydrogenase-like 6 [Morus notabilis]|uniref:Alcohol dehydrogenase-like 6 n=1 Tax=Morus notabilis TaxID=981085 RepID=W9SAH1_9ROSA|nr:Alcohol dehydrogenase-like 6 [Morus notabilis]
MAIIVYLQIGTGPIIYQIEAIFELNNHAVVAWGASEPLVIEEVEVGPPQPPFAAVTSPPGNLRQYFLGYLAMKHLVFTGECSACKQCKSGKSNICQALGLERRGLMHSDQKTRFFIKGRPVYHYCAVSSFSEYIMVHSGCAVKVNSDVPLEKICLLSCGVAAGLGEAWNVADVSKGSTVVTFGLGTVGLSVAQGAKFRGASRIIGVDTNPEKGEKAKAFGITDFINPNECNECIQQVVKRITDGGADYFFEFIGDTGMITTALESCCDGWGLTVTLGVPKVNPVVTAHYGLLLTGRTLKGSLFGGWRPKSDLPSLVDMYMKKGFGAVAVGLRRLKIPILKISIRSLEKTFFAGFISWYAFYIPMTEEDNNNLSLLRKYVGIEPEKITMTGSRHIIRGEQYVCYRPYSYHEERDTDYLDDEDLTDKKFKLLLSMRVALLPMRVGDATFVEPYYTNRFTCQFGFDQGIPSDKFRFTVDAKRTYGIDGFVDA